MDNRELVITKSTVECYKIRHSSGCYWADITVDAKDNQGRIQIASDFGDWQHYWGSCGRPFKKFLIQLDKQYLARKFRAEDYFDGEATITGIKRDIIKNRREGCLTQEVARAAYGEAVGLEEEGYLTADAFAVAVTHTSHLWGYMDDFPSIRKTYDPGFDNFWNMIWPIFINTLKSEIHDTK